MDRAYERPVVPPHVSQFMRVVADGSVRGFIQSRCQVNAGRERMLPAELPATLRDDSCNNKEPASICPSVVRGMTSASVALPCNKPPSVRKSTLKIVDHGRTEPINCQSDRKSLGRLHWIDTQPDVQSNELLP
jgi:hypothetical protein